MMKLVKANKKYLILVLVMVFSFSLVHIAKAVTEDTTTQVPVTTGEDYVASTAYVDLKVKELNTVIIDLSKTAKEQSDTIIKQNATIDEMNKSMKNLKFKPIELKAGQQLVAGEGTELVLRSGAAKAVGSKNGGLSDVITGAEIKNTANVPLNHLLLISRDDGRGLKASKNIWILIKGDYTIK